MGTLTSSLRIVLLDDVSKPARTVAQALKDAERNVKSVAKAMEGTGASSRFVTQISKLGLAKSDIDKVSASLRDYAKANSLAANSANWTRKQAADFRAFESQTVGALRRVTAEQRAFQTKSNAAIRAAAKSREAGGIGALAGAGAARLGGVALGMLGAGYGASKAIHAGAELSSERLRMSQAGIGREELNAADIQSAGLASEFTNVKRAAILETYKELRSVLLHPDETPHMMRSMIAAKSVMDSIDSTGQLSSGLQFAAKGAEVLGLAQDPERFKKYLDAFVKAQQVMGKTITPEMQFEFAKYLKASGAGLSDRFKMTTGVSLSQEMGGSTTGQSVDQFVKQIIGGFQGNNHAAAKEFVRLGLANKDDFQLTKSGEIKGMKSGRKVLGASLAQSDPDEWVYKHLMPAMRKAGITALDDQISEVRRLFPAGRAADLVTKIITQQASFANHAKLYQEATGLGGAKAYLRNDPTVAYNSLKTSIENLAGQMTSSTLTALAPTMAGLSEAIGGYTKRLSEMDEHRRTHPDEPSLGQKKFNALLNGMRGVDSDKAWGEDEDAEAAARLRDARAEHEQKSRQLEKLQKTRADLERTRDAESGKSQLFRSREATEAPSKLARMIPEIERLQGELSHLGGVIDAHVAWQNAKRAYEDAKRSVPSNMDKHQQVPGTVPGSRAFSLDRGYGGYDAKTGVPAKIHVDTSEADAAKQKLEETDRAKEALNQPARLNIDASSASAALRMVRELNAEIAKVGPGMSGLQGKISSLGRIQRGHFSTAGVQGE